jgi:hypothetical protein
VPYMLVLSHRAQQGTLKPNFTHSILMSPLFRLKRSRFSDARPRSADVVYCFARVRGLEPERLPPAYLVLQLRVAIPALAR